MNNRDLVQVAGVIPRALRNRAYASLAADGVKFRHWLRKTMEECFGEGGACEACQQVMPCEEEAASINEEDQQTLAEVPRHAAASAKH
jgi:hypothetical protein